MSRYLSLVAALSIAACGGNDEPPPQTAQGFQQGAPGQQPYGQQPYGQTAPGQPAPGQPPPGQQQPGQAQPAQPQAGQMSPLGAILSDPNTLQNIIAGALAGGAASVGALTGGELGPIQAGIKMKAQSAAPGMRPVGDLMSAKLQQGAHAQGSISLQPGKCYAVVGFGGLGVFDYQINIMTAPPLPPQVLAQSGAQGNDPLVGGQQCLSNPYPLPMQVNVDMHLIRGQGLVGAQAYVK